MSEPVFVDLGPGPAARQRYSAAIRERLEPDAAAILARYPGARSALLPLLHLVQAQDGYVSPAGIEYCADLLSLTTAEISAVATFYTMYRRAPGGDYLVGVCTNTLCAVMGGDAILDALTEHLDVRPGETTSDGTVTLEHIECNAACDFAPVVMVNWEFFDNQTPESARALVDDLRGGATVTPTRGAPVCTFRETARVLAGFNDGRAGRENGAAGAATLAGLRVAHELDQLAPTTESGNGSGATEPKPNAAAETIAEKPAPAPSADIPAQGNTADGKEH
ncbi:MAG TPA: NADH-quinone oxidoreductase subunit NuoE [Aldersonia sp.]